MRLTVRSIEWDNLAEVQIITNSNYQMIFFLKFQQYLSMEIYNDILFIKENDKI